MLYYSNKYGAPTKESLPRVEHLCTIGRDIVAIVKVKLFNSSGCLTLWKSKSMLLRKGWVWQNS